MVRIPIRIVRGGVPQLSSEEVLPREKPEEGKCEWANSALDIAYRPMVNHEMPLHTGMAGFGFRGKGTLYPRQRDIR